MGVTDSPPQAVGGKLGVLLQIGAGLVVTGVLLGGAEFVCGFFVKPQAVVEQPSLKTVEGDAVSTTLRWLVINPVPLVMDPDLLWRNKPLATKTQPVNPRHIVHDDRWSIAINSEGFRGHERTAWDADHDVYRILCIGDSITYGFNVEQNAAFPSRLEEMLRQRYPTRRFQVINAAVPGWSWIQGLRFLEKEGLALHPNLVIMAHGMNDQIWIAKITDAERIQYLNGPIGRGMQNVHALVEQTNTYRALARLLPSPPADSTDSPGCKVQIRETGICRRVSLPEIEASVHQIRRVTAAAGVDLLLLNLEFLETPAIEGLRKAVAQDGLALVDFVARFREWRQADEDARAEQLGLLPAQAIEPQRQIDGVVRSPGHRQVLLRVLAPSTETMSVKGASYAPGDFLFDETMYDDGTHGDEVANDSVFSVVLRVPANVPKIRYKYYLNGAVEFTALPPLPSTHHDRVKVFDRDTIAPIEVFGQVFLMAELAHPNAGGHERIAGGILNELQQFPSFAEFVGVAAQGQQRDASAVVRGGQP